MARSEPYLCLQRLIPAMVVISLGLFGTGCQSPLTVPVPRIER